MGPSLHPLPWQASPQEMGGPEVKEFFTHLAVKRRVAASTQTQPLCALLFLYKHVLRVHLPPLDSVRPKRPKRVPVVLSREEVSQLLEQVRGAHGTHHLMASLMYGGGLRLMECCRLRTKDVDIQRRQILIREVKGDKDRSVQLAESLVPCLNRHPAWRAELHRRDLARGVARVELPHAFERRLPEAARSLAWQFVFASERLSRCPRTGRLGRHHLHESSIEEAIEQAGLEAGIQKRVTRHVLRHSFANTPLGIG